jgi:hypothetical protein
MANLSRQVIALVALFVVPFLAEAMSAQPVPQAKIIVENVPDEGIQPRLFKDDAGTIHLVYFERRTQEGRDRTGDLYYRQRLDETKNWTEPVKITPVSFNHLGPVSKASAVIDDEYRVHVVWFVPSDGYYYSRSNLARTNFEPQQMPVKQYTEGLDAEASLATRGSTVTITWHAGDLSSEASRAVYSVSSNDYGVTFNRAKQVSDPALGACACCSLATNYDEQGKMQIAYRSAINNDGRHMQVLSQDHDNKNPRTVGEWIINTCPVSSNNLNGSWLAFENEARLFTVDLASSVKAMPLRASTVRQKHPVMATNRRGQRLVVWGEAGGYFAGGKLQTQLYDANNKPVNTPDYSSRVIKEYSVAAVVSGRDDNFLILY